MGGKSSVVSDFGSPWWMFFRFFHLAICLESFQPFSFYLVSSFHQRSSNWHREHLGRILLHPFHNLFEVGSLLGLRPGSIGLVVDFGGALLVDGFGTGPEATRRVLKEARVALFSLS